MSLLIDITERWKVDLGRVIKGLLPYVRPSTVTAFFHDNIYSDRTVLKLPFLFVCTHQNTLIY
jgi:hypothetical protein